MDYPYGPEPKKKTHPVAKTLEVVGDIAFLPDGGDRREEPPPPQRVAQWGIERWGEFAAGHGFSYRGELSVAIAADARLAASFDELRSLHFPLNDVGGLCEGTWNGVPFMSYTALNFGAGGSRWPYRFVCAPLPDRMPDLVHDSALRAKRPYHLDWYPRFAEYESVAGPVPPSKEFEKRPGLLARSVGKGLSKALDTYNNLTAPKLHCASREYAARLATKPYVRGAFDRDWAVKERWLVVFEKESQHRRTPEEICRFLDAFVAAKNFVWGP